MSGILIGLALCVIALLTFNTLVLSFAFLEHRRSRFANAWLTRSQSLGVSSNHKPLILMVHGFGGSPLDLRPLAMALTAAGYRVTVPALPGQTRADNPFNRLLWSPDSAIAMIKDLATLELKRSGQKPICAGFSMGATLSLMIAEINCFSKLVLIAPFLGNSTLCALSRLCQFAVPLIPKISSGQINDPKGRKCYRPGTWFLALPAVSLLCNLAKVATLVAPKIATPILVFASPKDRSASFSFTQRTFRNRPNTQFGELASANHILLYDYGREHIVQKVLEFIEAPS